MTIHARKLPLLTFTCCKTMPHTRKSCSCVTMHREMIAMRFHMPKNLGHGPSYTLKRLHAWGISVTLWRCISMCQKGSATSFHAWWLEQTGLTWFSGQTTSWLKQVNPLTMIVDRFEWPINSGNQVFPTRFNPQVAKNLNCHPTTSMSNSTFVIDDQSDNHRGNDPYMLVTSLTTLFADDDDLIGWNETEAKMITKQILVQFWLIFHHFWI